MSENNSTVEMLNELGYLKDRLVALGKKRDLVKESLIPDEIKQQLREVDEEFNTEIEYSKKTIDEFEEKVKKEVIAQGKTVSGESLQAVFMSGKVSWDSKKLDGMAIVLPEINKARSVGEPFVTIRSKGSGK